MTVSQSQMSSARDHSLARGDAELTAALLSFFRWTAESFWGDGPSQIDGGDFQEKAEALGLIVEVPYDPAEHGEWGANEYGLLPGEPWYVYAAPVRAALSPEER